MAGALLQSIQPAFSVKGHGAKGDDGLEGDQGACCVNWAVVGKEGRCEYIAAPFVIFHDNPRARHKARLASWAPMDMHGYARIARGYIMPV